MKNLRWLNYDWASNGASFKCLHTAEQQICVGNQSIQLSIAEQIVD